MSDFLLTLHETYQTNFIFCTKKEMERSISHMFNLLSEFNSPSCNARCEHPNCQTSIETRGIFQLMAFLLEKSSFTKDHTHQFSSFSGYWIYIMLQQNYKHYCNGAVINPDPTYNLRMFFQ
ncbi:hypothetical protein CY35_01G067600 [Sphagnum magellanicum]|nr:hypothetical protein CY35_01G067600 [Sphagnum magellanicum]